MVLLPNSIRYSAKYVLVSLTPCLFNSSFSVKRSCLQIFHQEHFFNHLTCDNGTVLSKNNGKALTKFTFVDQYIKVEENNLDFLRFNQTKLKAALYNGLADAVS